MPDTDPSPTHRPPPSHNPMERRSHPEGLRPFDWRADTRRATSRGGNSASRSYSYRPGLILLYEVCGGAGLGLNISSETDFLIRTACKRGKAIRWLHLSSGVAAAAVVVEVTFL